MIAALREQVKPPECPVLEPAVQECRTPANQVHHNSLRPRLEPIETLRRVKERATDRVDYAMEVLPTPLTLPRALSG